MYNSLRKHLQQAVIEAIIPRPSQNSKKAAEIAKKKRKHFRLQAKEGEVLTKTAIVQS